MRQLGWSMVILVGIFVLQASTAAELRFEELAQALLPILLAAVCYPLGNRKLMQYCPPEISTLERVFGMTLCSMPFWLVLGAWGVGAVGLPSAGQVIQSVGVALFSGVAATLLFFWATDQVRRNPRSWPSSKPPSPAKWSFPAGRCPAAGCTHSPALWDWPGLCLIVGGMVGGSLSAGASR